MTLGILLLAAGQSSRMRGADKLQEPIDGTPLLATMAQHALDTGLPVWVTLPGLDHPRARLVPRGATPVPVADAASGMSASIRAGIAALPPRISAVMILPADLPELTADDLTRVAQAYEGGILRATAADGTPGHPVVFPRTCFAELQGLQGDEGARPVISMHLPQLSYLALPGAHATTDLDTPEEWQTWHASR